MTAAAPRKPAISTAATFERAVGLFNLGQLETAEHLCRGIVEADPRHADALHVLGVIELIRDRAEAGAEFIRRSLGINPSQPHVHCSLGNALRDLRRPEEALASYRRALQIEPGFGGALYNEGNVLMDLGRSEEALRSYERALALQRDDPLTHLNRGNALLSLGRPEEALASYRQALVLQPDMTQALANCASVLRKLERPGEALSCIDHLYAREPGDLEVCLQRALLLCDLERWADALESLDAALRRQPDALVARITRARVLLRRGQFERALADCEALLLRDPSQAEAHCIRGLSLLALERPTEALASFAVALSLRPEFPEAADGQGSALRELNRLQEALAAFELASTLAPGSPDICYRRAATLRQLQRHEDAAAAFAEVLRLSPEYDYALGALLHERALSCDWTGHVELAAELERAVLAGRRACLPGIFLSLSGSAPAQLQCARTYAEDKLSVAPVPHRVRVAGPSRRRIRIAYVSGDFGEHPVSFLLAGVLERHDRDRFDTIAVSLQPKGSGPLGQRTAAAFSRFIDVSDRTDREVAALLRELEVDIAVDLMGFTSGSRAGLFAARAAPVQVNFLGCPGTLGAPCYDYILADRYVVPEAHRQFYSEKVVYLPHCFQPSDVRHVVRDNRRPTRPQYGLPQDAFVFCCFNASYKITPKMFDCWARILRQTTGSVLFLLGDRTTVVKNLRTEASRRGVAPERLVFGGRLPYEDYLARYRAADLCLDTLPYNAGTTASDALWAGLPLLTCAGGTFGGRMGTSLLRAIGLPDLVTNDLQEYETLACRIALTPGLAPELRTRLAEARLTTPLFDTMAYVRDLERAYSGMWERYQRDQAPEHFAVADLTE